MGWAEQGTSCYRSVKSKFVPGLLFFIDKAGDARNGKSLRNVFLSPSLRLSRFLSDPGKLCRVCSSTSWKISTRSFAQFSSGLGLIKTSIEIYFKLLLDPSIHPWIVVDEMRWEIICWVKSSGRVNEYQFILFQNKNRLENNYNMKENSSCKWNDWQAN